MKYTEILRGLLAALVTAFLITIPSQPASAAPGDAVDVVLTGLTPVVPKVGDTLVVSGFATNTTAEPLDDVSIDLRVSTSPLEYRAQIGEILDGSGARSGDPVVSSNPSTIAPGARVPFRLAVPFGTLNLPGNGVYYVAAEAVSPDGPLGRVESFVPWFPDPGAVTPANIVWLWPVSSPGGRDARNVVLDPTAPEQFRPGGRLSSILEAGAARPTEVSWAIDPQTPQEAELIARDHNELRGGSVVPQPGLDAASQWLAKLRGVTRGADASALPYSYPASTSEVSSRLAADLVLATTSAPRQVEEQLGSPVRGGLSFPAGGTIDQNTLNTLSGAGITTVVLNPAAVSTREDADSPFSTLRTDSGVVTAITPDPILGAVTGPVGPRQRVTQRQRFLAETALLSAVAGEPAGTAVVSPEMFWDPDRELLKTTLAVTGSAPWSRLQRLGDAVAAAESPAEATLTGTQPTVLSPTHMAGVLTASGTLGSIAAIMAAPGVELESYRQALLRSESAAWITDTQTGATLVRRNAAEIVSLRDQVRLSPPGTISFPGSEGRVPITIANDMEAPVTVRLALVATPAYRIRTEALDPITIPAGRKASLEVPVTVVGSGELKVSAQLLTPQGARYGRPQAVDLRTTAYSRAAAWVVGTAAGLLVLMIVITFFRRRSERATERRALELNPDDHENGGHDSR